MMMMIIMRTVGAVTYLFSSESVCLRCEHLCHAGKKRVEITSDDSWQMKSAGEAPHCHLIVDSYCVLDCDQRL